MTGKVFFELFLSELDEKMTSAGCKQQKMTLCNSSRNLFNNNNHLLRYFHNNTRHYLFKHKSYFVDEISCLSNIAWKTKAAVDRHTKGSMLLKRNKTFASISNSLKRLYLSVISLKNLNINYNITGMRKESVFHFQPHLNGKKSRF